MIAYSVDANLKRQIKIELAKKDFWEYCKLRDPEFYKEGRTHLKTLCITLDDFYQNKIEYKRLAIQMPPRHGKSRTLTNFCSWILGLSVENRIITASYGDDLAQDFSRFTRDIIQEDKNSPDDIVYSDIFPETKIKKGDASYKKWALEGQHFNYKGVGIHGAITGKGANMRIVDDALKDAEIAYNPAALAKIWLWYSGTFMSRGESGVKDIVCMTPWMKNDLLDILLTKEPDDWLLVSMPAYEDGEMLCDEILDYEEYCRLERLMDENIFQANYNMKRMNIKGKLYQEFKTYSEIPADTESSLFYTDTADEGNDFLCSIAAKRKGLFFYVTDVLYTKDPQEITEGEQVQMIINNKLRYGMIESNNGGRAFARNVERILSESGYRCSVNWFHQSKNKKARILTNAANVQKYILFPENWADLWPDFYNALNTYQKEGKNAFDDGPDAITGLLEHGDQTINISESDKIQFAKRRRVL